MEERTKRESEGLENFKEKRQKSTEGITKSENPLSHSDSILVHTRDFAKRQPHDYG